MFLSGHLWRGRCRLFFQRNGIKLSVFTLFTRAAWRAVFMPLCMTVLVMPEMAGATTTGTQTFKADITTGTCTVPGSQMTQTIDFGNIPRLKTLSGSDTDAETVGVPVVSRNIHFNVTGCPDGISLIGLEVGFTPWSVAHQSWIKNSGSAGGVAMAITDSGGGVMNTGDVLASGDLPQNGAVTIEGVVHVYRVVNKGLVTPGGNKRRGDSGVVFSVSPPEWKRIAGGGEYLRSELFIRAIF